MLTTRCQFHHQRETPKTYSSTLSMSWRNLCILTVAVFSEDPNPRGSRVRFVMLLAPANPRASSSAQRNHHCGSTDMPVQQNLQRSDVETYASIQTGVRSWRDQNWKREETEKHVLDSARHQRTVAVWLVPGATGTIRQVVVNASPCLVHLRHVQHIRCSYSRFASLPGIVPPSFVLGERCLQAWPPSCLAPISSPATVRPTPA